MKFQLMLNLLATRLKNLKIIPLPSNLGKSGRVKNRIIEITKKIIKSNFFKLKNKFIIFFSVTITMKIGSRYNPILDKKIFKPYGEKTIRN